MRDENLSKQADGNDGDRVVSRAKFDGRTFNIFQASTGVTVITATETEF
jgi:hypothetical protein